MHARVRAPAPENDDKKHQFTTVDRAQLANECMQWLMPSLRDT
jgi:hypothetical protein